MVRIGYRPVLWHVMRYFAYYGHTEFIVCLGYGGAAIKEYFLRYEEAVSNDFVMSDGGGEITMLGTDIADWRITFVDTGPSGTIGERLLAVRPSPGRRGAVPGQLRRHADRRPDRSTHREPSARPMPPPNCSRFARPDTASTPSRSTTPPV